MAIDPIARGLAASAPARAKQNTTTSKLSHKNRKIIAPYTLADYNASKAYVNGSGNTITSSVDTANGVYAGGEIINMNLTAGNTANQNKLYAYAPFYFPANTAKISYFVTFEMNVVSNTYATVTISDDGTPTNLVYMQFGLPNNKVSINVAGSGLGTVAYTPTNWNMAQWFRFTAVVVPATITTGNVYFYLHYKDTSTSKEAQLYVGTQPYSSNVIPRQIIVSNGSSATAASPAAQIARLKAYELYGIYTGCSLDAGYVGWCPDPNTGRTFSASAYNERRNPAWILAQELNGDGDFYLNHACGGFTVEDMSAGFSDWATQLNPKVLIIGSATNTIIGAQGNYPAGPSRDAYIAARKVDYLNMVKAAVATGAAVACYAVPPRNDGANYTGGLAAFNALALDWNAWMATACTAAGAAVVDLWSLMYDPNTQGLSATYDSGDGIHPNWLAQKLVGEAMRKALLSI